MKKAVFWIAGVLTCAALLVSAFVAYNSLTSIYSPETPSQATGSEATPAPDFVVYDADGNPVTLSQLRGKPVVINAWATWCSFCVDEMPYFDVMAQTYGDQVHFMMINLTTQDDLEAAQAFIADTGYSFPVYYDTDGMVSGTYPVSSIPVTFFVDANGNYMGGYSGQIPESVLENNIVALLSN